VITVTTHKIQHKTPGKDAVKAGQLSTTDSRATGTAPPSDKRENGMQTDNNPPSMTLSDKTLQADQADTGGSDMLIETPSPLQCTLDVIMDTSDGKRECKQGKEYDASNTTLDSYDPSPTDDEQIITPPMKSP
jgi:hypothetical protein